MPVSDDVQSTALAQLSDDDEDPEELEQVDQELEEQRDEVDMDISNSPIHVHPRDERQKDTKYEGLGGHLGPGSSTRGKAEAGPPSNVLDVEESTSNSNFCGTSNEALRLKSHNFFARAGDYRSQEFARNDAGILSGKKTSTRLTDSHANAKGVINSDDEIKHVLQPTNDGKQIESRLSGSAASNRGTHIRSPVAETSDPNKRPAIVCDFYAKGWCIRGASCRFIHTKDSPMNSYPHPEGDVASASCSKEVRGDEGLRDIPERSRLPAFHDPLASSSGNSFPFSLNQGILRNHQLQSVQREESNVGDSSDVQKLHLPKDDLAFLTSYKGDSSDVQKLHLRTDDLAFLTSYKDVEKEGRIRNWLADDYNKSPNKKGRYATGNTSSHSSSLEDLTGVRIQRVHGDHTSPLVSHSLNSNTVKATGLFPSGRTSNCTGFSLRASYSSLDANPLSSKKLLGSNRDYNAYTRPSAFLKSSSPFTNSELNNYPPTGVSQISSNKWEPSEPFRPSLILPSAFPSFSPKQYDPLRGSIELPKLLKNSFEASFHSDGAIIGKKLHPKVLAETGSGTLHPACDADTNSMSSHNEKVLDNSCYTRDPNSPVNEAETVGTSVVYQNGTLTKDENPLGHSQVKDGDVQQESKEMRQFRGALIELVKELLKPKWREGTLSKDAHNKIVKKAVDKIISAFQPQQIPPTIEAVTQYLSACRPKISKLVEGYIERYGKT
ncbi:protein FRIGIDA-ESSENTIAL 1 isoform X2 [Argentina anserina]|uniref:protein FRIGIDA-ESSENTIAL 1 isoform X2 n=1 Tax=Argentina anserina TaxID=57926 RepID=UPI00217680AF|nr:protein FRIGIDA-ESSENTIAL 1 isoform X2 [Potentilla anserina]